MGMSTTLAALAILAAGFAPGCASSGHERAELLKERIHGAVEAVDAYGSSRKAAFESMTALVAEPLEDIPARFETFSTSVDHVVSADRSLRGALAKVQRSAEARFRVWGEENRSYVDDEMRSRSERNRFEAEESFRKAVRGAEAVLEQSAGFVGYLSNLRKFLSNDLSQVGVAGVADFTARAEACNGRLDELVRPLRASLVEAADAMNSPKSPP